MAWDLS